MEKLRTIQENGKTFVVLPIATFEQLQEDAEMLADIEAYDKAKALNEEAFPLTLLDQIEEEMAAVKLLRQYRKMTQKTLAKKAGITEAYLCQIETGVRKGSASVLKKIAKALRVDLDMLVI
jgi:DNA-binding XRE family transcriptional regulator